MAEDFAGMGIAVIVVTASIVLAGILIGLGKAFGYKRIEQFGIEELIQSVVNAAIIGSFAAIVALVASVSSNLVSTGCPASSVADQLLCSLTNVNTSLLAMLEELIRLLGILSYYQGLSLNFGAFSILPLANLSSVSGALSTQLLAMNLTMILLSLNLQMTSFIALSVLGILFPAGLVLRTLFATRRVGGFLIGLAIGLYLFYPTFVLIFPEPTPSINNATIAMQGFNNNTYYAPVPVVDLNDNYALAGKLDVMSGRCSDPAANQSNGSRCFNLTSAIPNSTSADLAGDLTVIAKSDSDAISQSLLYAVIAPLFSLLVTAVFVKELSSLLGSEIGIRTIASI
jgi:hypothetical protein